MKKLFSILAGVSMPWMAFGQIYYDSDGVAHSDAGMYGNGYQIRDDQGLDAGHAERNAQAGWTFYDRFGRIIGSADGGK